MQRFHLYSYDQHNKIVTFFKGDMISTSCLNQEIDWEEKYFDKIRLAIDVGGGLDMRYSFKQTDDDTSSNQEFTLKVNERLQLPGSKKLGATEVSILKVKVKVQPQNSTLDSLFSTFIQINKNNKNSIQTLQDSISKLEKQRQNLLAELERNSLLHKKHDTDQTNHFVLLINKKKQKIRDLEQEHENYKQQKLEQYKPDNQGIMVDEEMGGSSQFQMSQPPQMSSLFEQSLECGPIKRRQDIKPDTSKKHNKDELINTKKEDENQSLLNGTQRISLEDIVGPSRKKVK